MLRRIFSNVSNDGEDKVSKARRFAKDEEGAFIVYVVFTFIVIVALTGMGVDMMNFERDRASLQATLDRAVLAAADLDQTLPAQQVVESYLEKSGSPGKLVGPVEVVNGLGSRKVTALAETVVDTHFMRLSGVHTLNAYVTSTAEESVGAVEISLVLDMSGSMSWASAEAGKSKMDVLQGAAKKFVTEMISKQKKDDVSISIIPYATQVNAGERILGKFTNVTSEHNYSHCVNFKGTQFKEFSLPTSAALTRTAHFDVYTSPWREGNTKPTCPVRAGSEITPFTNDIDRLHKQIDALTPFGRTSIDIGVKWATTMLDPAFRPVVEKLTKEKLPKVNPDDAEKTVVPTVFSTRPLNYDADVLKVIVVMTDGENTGQFKLKGSLRSGNSNVWHNPDYPWHEGGEYSVRMSTNPDRWWWTRQGVYEDHAYGEKDWEPGESRRLTKPELFARTNMYWNAVSNFQWEDNYYNNWYSSAYSQISATTKNTRTKNICSQAKGKNMIVYAIAFEAPTVGVTTMKNCASSDSHFFSVNSDGNLDGSDPNAAPQTLEQVFITIASSIKKLRLTQ